jgi:hypothetical protein
VGVCGKVPGLRRKLTGCPNGLRIDEAVQRFVDGSHEGLLASIDDVSRPSGRGAEAIGVGGHSRRRRVISRWLALVLFGAPELVGSSRSSSSELGLG